MPRKIIGILITTTKHLRTGVMHTLVIHTFSRAQVLYCRYRANAVGRMHRFAYSGWTELGGDTWIIKSNFLTPKCRTPAFDILAQRRKLTEKNRFKCFSSTLFELNRIPDVTRQLHNDRAMQIVFHTKLRQFGKGV